MDKFSAVVLEVTVAVAASFPFFTVPVPVPLALTLMPTRPPPPEKFTGSSKLTVAAPSLVTTMVIGPSKRTVPSIPAAACDPVRRPS